MSKLLQMMLKRLQAKLKEVHTELRRRMHDPVPKQGTYLLSFVAGHIRYYGVPMNGPSVSVFRKAVCEIWLKVLRRLSHKHRLTWARMERLIHRWFPLARVCHPYPLVRFSVIIEGRSPVR